MANDKFCKVYLCDEKTMENSDYCSKDHKEMDCTNEILSEMLWNGEIPFK